jgi:5'-3' exonuclease
MHALYAPPPRLHACAVRASTTHITLLQRVCLQHRYAMHFHDWQHPYDMHGDCRVLREYLKEETYLREAEATYELERVIDDFVLLCVLVGNDFLPHSPTLDINEGGLDLIFDCYRELCVRRGVYLTHGELISHAHMETFCQALAAKELETLTQRAKVWRWCGSMPHDGRR